MVKRNFVIIASIFVYWINPMEVHGQFFKKLKKQAEEKALNRADELLSKEKSTGQKGKVEKPSPSKNETVSNKKNQETKTTQTVLDDSDILIYKSPNPAFKDVVIQQFKGLPRFGSCDYYEKSHKIVASQPELAKAMNEKREKLKIGYLGFLKLAKINLLGDLFKSMDKTALTLENRNLLEEEVKSRKAQELLLDFAFWMGTNETKLKYFCDNPSDSGRCGFARKWGGQRADDFTENEKYVEFVETYLDDILAWSRDFFKDGHQTVYLVHHLRDLSTYDFDKNGFWVSLPHKMRNNFHLDYNNTGDGYFQEFVPENGYGQQMLNKTNQVEYIDGKVLFKIEPGEAETLLNNKEKKIQAVSKVSIVFKGLDEANRLLFFPTFSYHFVEPMVEIYEDVQLTKKIGSLDMRQLTYKEN
ncbi:hypothetical protein [Flagellimonas flava]|uniref:hypothetical protein n=1 Tax=Flagellimonas flava TaxID=570519 RepID=UPI003D65E1E8